MKPIVLGGPTALLAASLAAASPLQQHPFTSSPALGSLDVSNPDVAVFTHKAYPGHRVRARQPKLCEEREHVERWSGYIDTPEDRHFYFSFWASRNDPVNDPVLGWLNGGPGCASSTGLLMEHGPCRVTENGDGLVDNPYSWSSNASVIYFDQPVDVGYSYSSRRGDRGVWSTEAAMVDFHAFVSIWMGAFAETYGKNDFHLSGESFAGRYIPLFADYIMNQNKLALAEPEKELPVINLKTVAIGNGFTDPLLQHQSSIPMACTNTSGYGPFLEEATCDKMRDNLPRCIQLQQSCYNNPKNTLACITASEFCERTQGGPYYETGLSPYDIIKKGDYEIDDWIDTFLNRADVRHELGVDSEENGGVKKFTGCSNSVGFRFSLTGDGAKPSYQHVANLLDAGVPVLAYIGKRDFICNYIGNEMLYDALEWSGKAGFNNATTVHWFGSDPPVRPEDTKAGSYRTYGNLTFAIVDEAGHMVPYDRPANSLALIITWLHAKHDGKNVPLQSLASKP